MQPGARVSDKQCVTILGAGMFGTALSNIIAENGHEVYLWTRDPAQAEAMTRDRENARSLPGYPIRPEITVVASARECVPRSGVIFVAVPSIAFREIVRGVASLVEQGRCLVSTTKGIEANGFKLMSQILREEVPHARIGVLSGPNLAEEIAQRQLTATVIASDDEALNILIQGILHTEYFRVYSSTDTYGIELAGALKNIYAIAAGFAAALGVGQNTQGMLLTRSLAEMSRFAVSMGANPLTFLGLAGVGDLMVTCSSPLSRNYQIGMYLGQGATLDEAIEKLGRLAEGVNTVRLVKEQADKKSIYMPLVAGLFEILFNGKAVEDVVYSLMMADLATDVEFVVNLPKQS